MRKNVLSNIDFKDMKILDVYTLKNGAHKMSKESEPSSKVDHRASNSSRNKTVKDLSECGNSEAENGCTSIMSQSASQKQSTSRSSTSNQGRKDMENEEKFSASTIDKLTTEMDKKSNKCEGKFHKQNEKVCEEEITQSSMLEKIEDRRPENADSFKEEKTELGKQEKVEARRQVNSGSGGREKSESRRQDNSGSGGREKLESRRQDNSGSGGREKLESRRQENSGSGGLEKSESRRQEDLGSGGREKLESRRLERELYERSQQKSGQQDYRRQKFSPLRSDFRHGPEGRFPRPIQGASETRKRPYVREGPEDCLEFFTDRENRSLRRSRTPESFERQFSPPRRRSPGVQRFSRSHVERPQYIHSPDFRDYCEDREFRDERCQRSRSPIRKRPSPRILPLRSRERLYSPECLPPDEWRSASDTRSSNPDEFRSACDSMRYVPDVRRPAPDTRHPALDERRPPYERERPHRDIQYSKRDWSSSPRNTAWRNEEFREHFDLTDHRRDYRSPPRAVLSSGRSGSPHRRAHTNDGMWHNEGASNRPNEVSVSSTTSLELPNQLPVECAEPPISRTKKPTRNDQSSNSLFDRALSSLAVLHNDECRAYMKRPTSHPRYNTELSKYLGSSDCLSLIALGTPQNAIIESFNSYVWENRLQEVFEEDWQKKKEEMLKLMSDKKGSRHSKKSSGSKSKRPKNDRSPSPNDSPKLASEKESPMSRSSKYKSDEDHASLDRSASSSIKNLQPNSTEMDGVQKQDVNLKSSTSCKSETSSILELPQDLTNKNSVPSDELAAIYSQIFKASLPPTTGKKCEPGDASSSEKMISSTNQSSERYSPGMESDTSMNSPAQLNKGQSPTKRKSRSRSPKLASCFEGKLDFSVGRSPQSEEDSVSCDVNVVSVLSVINEFAHKIGSLADGVAELLQRTQASVKHGINPLKCVFEEDRRLCASVYEKLNAIVTAESTSFIEKVIVQEALSQLSSLLALFHSQPRKVTESEIEEWASITLHMNPTDTILFLKKKMSEQQQGIIQTVEQLYMAVKERHKNLIKSNLQDKISFFLPSTSDANLANKNSHVNSRNSNKSENPSLLNRVHPAFSVYDDVDDDDENCD